MVASLESLLKDVESSESSRNDMFGYVFNRGYYTGAARDDARRAFDGEVAADSPRRQQLLSAYLPSYTEYRASSYKLRKSVGVVAVGAAASVLGAGAVATAGAAAVAAGVVMGAYYFLKRLFR